MQPIVLLLACLATSPADDPVLARVGSEVVTGSTLEAYWQALPAARRSGYERGGGRKAFLSDLVDQMLVVQGAEAHGLLEDRRLAAAADLARDAVIYHAYVDREVTQKIISEEALRAWYGAHLDRFGVEEMVRVSQIIVTPWPERDPAARRADDARDAASAEAKANRLLAELRGGASFEEVAGRASEDTPEARSRMSEPVPRGRLAAPVEEASFALKPGELSGVLKSTYGYHILRLDERVPARVRSLDEVRAYVAEEVTREKKAELTPAFEKLLARLRQEIPVKIEGEPKAAPSSGKP